MRLGYADPPYIGCAHLYKDQPEYVGEIDHAALVSRLMEEFDGWVLHASASPHSIAAPAPLVATSGARSYRVKRSCAAVFREMATARCERRRAGLAEIAAVSASAASCRSGTMRVSW